MAISALLLPLAAAAGAPALPTTMLGFDIDSMVLCADPNEAGRACRATVSYRKLGDGVYEETSRSMINGEPDLSIEMVSQSTVRDGAICGTSRLADFQKAKLFRNGVLVSGARARAVLSQLRFINGAMGEKENCISFQETRSGLRATFSVTGDRYNNVELAVRWVGKDEGYTVRATNGLVAAPVQPAR